MSNWQDTKVAIAVMKGGLNLAASPLALDPGEAIQLHNYEVDPFGRYRRVDGYERFDGRKKPSEQSFFSLTVDDASSFAVPGNVVGATSGATGTVIAVSLTSNQLALVEVTGEFVPGETLGAATVVSPLQRNYVADSADEDTFTLATVEYYRALIQKVPGSGPILGVAQYKGQVLAFRNNVDGDQCHIHRSTPNGWVRVTTGPVLQPNGKYKFRVHNFGGAENTAVLIGVDGKNKAFSYNNVSFTQISTGMVDDRPVALEVIGAGVLLLGYESGSLLISALGDPLDYSVANGAGEIAVGDSIMELDVQPNKTTAIFCKSSIKMLYGEVRSDMQLTTLDSTASTKPSSIRGLGDTVFVTDSGISRLTRVQEFGDYDTLGLSAKVKPLLDKLLGQIVSAFVVRSKGQYRLVFSNNLMLICTMGGGEVIGFSTADYGLTVRCSSEAIGPAGTEEVYFGSDDGYVYQADKGISFDGRPIRSIIRPAFNNLGNPEHRKRFKKLVLEIDTPTRVAFRVSADQDYMGAYTTEAAISPLITASGGASFFDDATWDEARWTTAIASVIELYITGVGQRISPCVYSESANSAPHTLSSITLHWSARGRKR